ncbi:TetR family transcriptional regulator [Streptomyces tsukubensis]|uniref:TetR family transcriptional regulator n=1 Tax=Streptomyces tsukubensis TaxID=83656 RepID=A0A1V4AA08_9ACTN|nr:TetR family transcriptional regulator [Streptomyces tsukubensis]OON79675.1 TetR family transcriptional regulator [Streptomyces tsukubensis]QFR95864.1 TetR family transcriptional regulator [Streptomyces tsukubensis]
MSHTDGVRQAQKRKTRQALLDAALGLLAEQSLSSLGLREVTRAAGVAPTAFYRHFRDIPDLGVALVDEALGGLHGLVGTMLAAIGESEARISGAVGLIAGHVRDHPDHVRFVARERHGGVQPVREAIRLQLDRFAHEVASALSVHPESAEWAPDDLLMLSELYVDHMVMTASALLEAEPEEAEEVARRARRRMRLVDLGRGHWLD